MLQGRLTSAGSSWCFHTARCWNDLLYCKVERLKMQLHLSGANFKKAMSWQLPLFPAGLYEGKRFNHSSRVEEENTKQAANQC